MKNKKIILSSTIVLTTILPISTMLSCKNKIKNKNRIAFVKSTDNSSYDQLLSDLGKKYAKELGYEWDAFSSSANETTESSRVDDIINSKKYKTVVFQPVNGKGSFNNLKKLLDAKLYVSIPDRIFTKDQVKNELSKTQKHYLTMMVTSDNTQIAYDATKLLIKKINEETPNAFSSPQEIYTMEGESGSASSEERKKGFTKYITEYKNDSKNSSNNKINTPSLIGQWSDSEAAKVFEAVSGKKGLGIFAFNDQMAHGIITSSANKDIDGFYPIVAVDGNKKYKNEIGNGKNKNQRVIANYAQRSHTTMKIAVQSVVYALLKDKFQKSKEVKWIEDDQTTNDDDNGKTPLRDVTKSWDVNKVIIKLSGIAITRGDDGKLINEQWMVE